MKNVEDFGIGTSDGISIPKGTYDGKTSKINLSGFNSEIGNCATTEELNKLANTQVCTSRGDLKYRDYIIEKRFTDFVAILAFEYAKRNQQIALDTNAQARYLNYKITKSDENDNSAISEILIHLEHLNQEVRQIRKEHNEFIELLKHIGKEEISKAQEEIANGKRTF